MYGCTSTFAALSGLIWCTNVLLASVPPSDGRSIRFGTDCALALDNGTVAGGCLSFFISGTPSWNPRSEGRVSPGMKSSEELSSTSSTSLFRCFSSLTLLCVVLSSILIKLFKSFAILKYLTTLVPTVTVPKSKAIGPVEISASSRVDNSLMS